VLRPTALDAAIERIQTEVHQHGSCLVSEEELFLICGDAVDDSERFASIRTLAMQYQWAFQLDGRASSVVFKQLPAERADGIRVNGLAIERISD
jgi:hypothetical protein